MGSEILNSIVITVIFGSSHIRRLRDFTHQHKDATPHFGMAQEKCVVHYAFLGGGNTWQLDAMAEEAVKSYRPDVCVIHIGSNDIKPYHVAGGKDGKKVAYDVFNLAMKLHIYHGVKQVVISLLFRRGYSSCPDYNQLVFEINEHLMEHCARMPMAGIRTWRHHKMSQYKKFLHRDKIHLNYDA